MSEKAENLLNNLVETLTEGSTSKEKSVSFFGEEKSESISESVSSKVNKLFGREKPIHHVLGGGKSADVLLWRDKKKSASVLTTATVVWVVFEWLNYNFLTIINFILIFGLLGQFLWSNASGIMSRSSSSIPRVTLPKELFVDVAVKIGTEINRALQYVQDIACGGNLKQLLVVIASLWAAAILGSWCNLLTVIYVGFVAAHTLPAVYEKYDDQIDNFLLQLFEQLRGQYRKLDSNVLSKIPKGKAKKDE